MSPRSSDPGKSAATTLLASPLFSGIQEEEVEALASSGRCRRYRTGAYVFAPGDPSSEVYSVVEGSLQVSSTTADGRTQLHTVILPGQLFGELGVLSHLPRAQAAICLEDSLLWEVSDSRFVEFVVGNPAMAEALLAALARQVLTRDALIEDMLFLDLKARVAKRLLALVSDSWDEPPADGTALPWDLTQTDLANLCGGSREQVNRILSDFTRRGLVARSGRRYALTGVPGLRGVAGLE